MKTVSIIQQHIVKYYISTSMRVLTYLRQPPGLATERKRKMSHYNKISAVMLAMRNEQSRTEKIKIKVKGEKNGVQRVDSGTEKLQLFPKR